MEEDSRVSSSHSALLAFLSCSGWLGLDCFTEAVSSFFPSWGPRSVCPLVETEAGGLPSGQASELRAATCGGVSHLQTLPAEPSWRLGSLSETPASRLACPLCGRLPSCQLLQWHQGERSPDLLPRGQGSSSRARGSFSGAGARGILRLQRESEVCVLDCSSRGDSGGRGPGGLAMPAGELGTRAEARGSESPAPASLALRRAALRGPRATARPRAHARPGDAQAPGAPGAGIGCRWT